MATPAPPINNSPATPTGTNRKSLSTMYCTVFGSGFPTVIEFTSLSVMSLTEDDIVASDGPYALNNCTLEAQSFCKSS